MNKIPTQTENPKGLHQRYIVSKIDKEGDRVDPDTGSEYFVMRLDEGGKDLQHIKACRIGVHAYADAIKYHIPELAKDLKDRYPLIRNDKMPPPVGTDYSYPRPGNRLDLMSPGEKAIYNAVMEVEKIGAHTELTAIVIELGNLQDRLYNYYMNCHAENTMKNQ